MTFTSLASKRNFRKTLFSNLWPWDSNSSLRNEGLLYCCCTTTRSLHQPTKI